MIIHNISITNFKSIYGTQTFDFDSLQGIIKLSGVVGAGKTTLGEAILWGLFGETKDLKQESLVAWHTKTCCIDINLTSRNHDINIHRDLREPLEVKIDGKMLAASNKRKTQELLENEYYDVPRLAIERMCIVSFNSFSNSICKLNPHETKQFLDEIFGFNIFTEYNDEIVLEKKNEQTSNNELTVLYDDAKKQIEYFEEKRQKQQKELENTIDIDALNEKRKSLIEEGKQYKEKLNTIKSEYDIKYNEVLDEQKIWRDKKSECMTLGKQKKEWLKKFESGICPTCGHEIGKEMIEEQKKDMLRYADMYKEYEAKEKSYNLKLNEINNESEEKQKEIKDKIDELKKAINDIDLQVKMYNNSLDMLKENYDGIINDYSNKKDELGEELKHSDQEITEWNEMNELFSKTFRYNLLNNLIPHINDSIHYFTNKFDLPFVVHFDEEFKAHIYVDTIDDEITYNNLSTGQKKELDVAIIFGILQNIISNLNFNVYFLDELMSNMDTDTRNVILNVIKKKFSEDKTIFIINHAEMQDDYFTHKIRVTLENKKIQDKKKNDVVIKCSKYDNIF